MLLLGLLNASLLMLLIYFYVWARVMSLPSPLLSLQSVVAMKKLLHAIESARDAVLAVRSPLLQFLAFLDFLFGSRQGTL